MKHTRINFENVVDISTLKQNQYYVIGSINKCEAYIFKYDNHGIECGETIISGTVWLDLTDNTIDFTTLDDVCSEYTYRNSVILLPTKIEVELMKKLENQYYENCTSFNVDMYNHKLVMK
jgi:hypothetical protein